MRASELFGLDVYDRTGREVGVVHDVRTRREFFDDRRERLTIDGLVVGSGSVGIRLGYGHGCTRGPWMLTQLFRRRARDTRFVPWDVIARRTATEVHLDIDAADLRPESET
jgi:sporulation protein YlmC with PRC-barrel domain